MKLDLIVGEVHMHLWPNSTLLQGCCQDRAPGARGQKGRGREFMLGKGLVPKDGASQEDLARAKKAEKKMEARPRQGLSRLLS